MIIKENFRFIQIGINMIIKFRDLSGARHDNTVFCNNPNNF